MPASDWWTPVEDSPCTRKTTAGLVASMAAMTSAGGIAAPSAGGLTCCTTAPNRAAMSATRSPQMPELPMRMVSPGSIRLAMQASMPACPVPEMRAVAGDDVWKR